MKTKQNKEQLIYGRNPVVEALEGGRQFERIFIRDSLHGEFEKLVRHKCQELDVPLKRVPSIKLDKITNYKNHQGIAGMLSLIQYASIEDIIPFVFEKGESPVILVLDNIQDIRNMGAISRTAEAFGVHAMVISGKNSGFINADAVKASAGSLLRIPLCRESSIDTLIQSLKTFGIKVVGTTLRAGKSIGESDLRPPLAVVLGSEGKGLSTSVEEKCDALMNIPLKGITDSLNVSVASGIILYEVINQSNEDGENN